jgi:hypothetical protein
MARVEEWSGCVARPLLCLLRWHKWLKRYADDGAVSLVCRRCGREGEAGRGVWGYSDYV